MLGHGARATDPLAGSMDLALTAAGLWVALSDPTRGYSHRIPGSRTTRLKTIG